MKITLLVTCLCISLIGCKPSELLFKPDDINAEYVKHLLKVANENQELSGGKIFVAELEEDYVSRDGIAEETIINIKSKKPRTRIAKKGLTYRLYIITNEDSTDRSSIFLPSIFNADDICIGLGPAFVGTWGAGELKYFKKLVYYPKKKKKQIEWVYSKKESEYSKSDSTIHPFDDSKTKIEIKFQADVKKNILTLPDFKIINIFTVSDNRFGGNKPMIFHIASIFEDPDALSFRFLRSF